MHFARASLFGEVALFHRNVETIEALTLFFVSPIGELVDTLLPRLGVVLVVLGDFGVFEVEEGLALDVFGAAGGVVATEVANVVFEGVTLELVPLGLAGINEEGEEAADDDGEKDDGELEHFDFFWF